MANHKSAEKRARSNERRRVSNRMFLSKVRTSVTKLRTAIAESKEPEVLKKLFKTAQSDLAKAASKGVIKAENSSRRIARLCHAVKKATGDLPPTSA